MRAELVFAMSSKLSDIRLKNMSAVREYLRLAERKIEVQNKRESK